MTELSEVQKTFIELELKKEEIKKYFEDLKVATQDLADEIGIGNMFQDPSDGTVFQVVEPEGKYVNFEKVSYVRTKRAEEKRGTLSVVKAREAGFDL